MQRSPYFNDEYTIGWISGCHEELVVAMAMLDEEHGIPQSIPEEDPNSYHLGGIGEHKVVITFLPAGETGIGPSVMTAENMRRTFKNLKVLLSVSTGGAVPDTGRDIRLGDVVIGYPSGVYSGVVQFDHGKLEGDGSIKRKDWRNTPSRKASAAVDLLRAYQSRPKNPINNMPVIIDELGAGYAYPPDGECNDVLYERNYVHAFLGEPCDKCNQQALVLRKSRRTPSKPKVHYGNIASGNMVIRNGLERDKINQRYDNSILCLDTQAAGMSWSLPCVAIRGISNYSDSHANDRWQKRAIAVASAYAKELLTLMEPHKVELLLPVEPWVLLNRVTSQSLISPKANRLKGLGRQGGAGDVSAEELKNLLLQFEAWLKLMNVREL
ncbi:purine and uridine phosphorylase [Aspergillus steynii IBT 23096]|uniref:Purine and uridine phosphorylase n=1 Tax=Aspergillus steynii IBT 23096 TaxID=1392250 RepID=A0A2I2GHH0_9EURO|nr:purine and uridine phosphorylase [Aspergillus steynii IBT 23096]PLB52319.1 purine and uridine phosphorylase [Aspergillus steynii IBT 23096]